MNHKAKMVLSSDVYRKIKWLTYNYNKEIGAIGVGKMRTKEGKKQFHIDKLFFPKQKVTAASIHFTAEMWADLYKDPEFVKRMGDVCFYWHKHPGSAAHSHTDEEDTFETFMDPIAKRKWFGFLQTAVKSDGSMDTEARIELATPLRISIQKADIDLMYEFSSEKLALMKLEEKEKEKTKIEMEEIIDKVIVKPVPWTPQTTTTPGTYQTCNKECVKEIDDALEFVFGTHEEKGDSLYMDNDTVSGQTTSDEEKASVNIYSGQARIKTGTLFEKTLLKALTDDSSPLKSVIKKYHLNTNAKGEMKEYILQPYKKQYQHMKAELEQLFILYNEWVEQQMIEQDIPTTNSDNFKDFNYIINRHSDAYWEIIGDYAVWQIIGDLDTYVDMEWDATGRHCRVTNIGKDNTVIGTVQANHEGSSADFKGTKLIQILAKHTDDLIAEDCFGYAMSVQEEFEYGDEEEEN